jgi:hypothetical protein
MTGFDSKRQAAQNKMNDDDDAQGYIAEYEAALKSAYDNGFENGKKAAQRKPLTDKDILADETLRYYFGQNGGAGPVSKQGRKVVDAIEAAHNIKDGT